MRRPTSPSSSRRFPSRRPTGMMAAGLGIIGFLAAAAAARSGGRTCEAGKALARQPKADGRFHARRLRRGRARPGRPLARQPRPTGDFTPGGWGRTVRGREGLARQPKADGRFHARRLRRDVRGRKASHASRRPTGDFTPGGTGRDGCESRDGRARQPKGLTGDFTPGGFGIGSRASQAVGNGAPRARCRRR
ncbi:MAG: hypothetical protein MZW92_69740 [Comamonadaceae bacterium]|nr:hypothetical protein [Comamonadaceae bacterium]